MPNNPIPHPWLLSRGKLSGGNSAPEIKGIYAKWIILLVTNNLGTDWVLLLAAVAARLEDR